MNFFSFREGDEVCLKTRCSCFVYRIKTINGDFVTLHPEKDGGAMNKNGYHISQICHKNDYQGVIIECFRSSYLQCQN